jgi:sugar phosphate permease
LIPVKDTHAATPETVEKQTIRRITRRLVLLLFVVYILNYLDRTNIAIAKAEMSASIGLSEVAYGLGAGLFFIGYVIFEVPSNLVLYRVGARLWITRIMVSWGLVAMAMAFVQGEVSFYVLRFLLGAAEAGLVPGVLLYLTGWVPSVRRARIIALFYVAVPVSTVIGAPLCGFLMGFTPFGVEGWRFMFFITGLPCLFVAVIVFFFLTDSPAQARWLTEQQRHWLTGALLAEETTNTHAHQPTSLKGVVRDPRVLGMAFVFFAMVVPIYALAFFLPAIVRQMGDFGNLQVGLITAVPYAAAAVMMLVLSRRSDRTGERVLHYVVPALVGAGGLLLGAVTLSAAPAVALLGFCIGAIGCISTLPVFWSITPQLLTGVAAAGGIAFVCAVGNIGGFVAPYMVALIRGEAATTADSTNAVLVNAAILATGACVMYVIGRSLAKVTRPAGSPTAAQASSPG